MFARLFGNAASLRARRKRTRQSQPRARRICVESLEPRSLLAVSVVPSVETASASGADDIAIWIHPTDTSQSTIIGAVKTSSSSLRVYDLSGRELQRISTSQVNNVDLRYNFPLSGQTSTLLVGSRRSNDSIAIYKVNPQTGLLQDVAARTISTGMKIYGAAMYVSPTSGKYYAFVSSESGQIQQWELFATTTGKVDARQVRSFSVGSQSEGLVADDLLGHLYVGEEDVGIWKYSAEPGGGNARTRVDTTAAGGHLRADVEGLSIYYGQDGAGYLLASSQGSHEFAVYRRAGDNSFVGSFKLISGGGIDAVSDTDGIDVTNFPLGNQFPLGMFVAQDNDENFKLARFDAIDTALGNVLTLDTSWDPRLVGAGPIPNQAPQVNAGADLSIGFGASATLSGTVSDGGKPSSAALSSSWSVVSGPGSVQFSDSSLVTTTATFSALGAYVLRLSASDGELSGSDDVTVQVSRLPQSAFFQDGVTAAGAYTGTRDTMISGDSKNATGGAATSLKLDGSPDRGVLLAWDISSLPTGSSVQSANIQLQITDASSQTYPVYGLVRPWQEQQATWKIASTGVNWASAGAQGANDRNATQIGTLSARRTGQATLILNAAGVALVQSWVNNPATNHGIIIQRYSASNAIAFNSSEASSVTTRPRLNLTFTTTDSPLASVALKASTSQWDAGAPQSVDSTPTVTAANRDAALLAMLNEFDFAGVWIGSRRPR
jgi:myo-inositol-hexaphosphate 3-phosphohydrolase